MSEAVFELFVGAEIHARTKFYVEISTVMGQYRVCGFLVMLGFSDFQ